jgi:hypothetical protein
LTVEFAAQSLIPAPIHTVTIVRYEIHLPVRPMHNVDPPASHLLLMLVAAALYLKLTCSFRSTEIPALKKAPVAPRPTLCHPTHSNVIVCRCAASRIYCQRRRRSLFHTLADGPSRRAESGAVS